MHISKNTMSLLISNIPKYSTPHNVTSNAQEKKTGFLDGLVDSNLALRPKLLISDYSKGMKVLSDIS